MSPAAQERGEYAQTAEALMAVDVTKEDERKALQQVSALAVTLQREFQQAELDRQPTEERLLKDLRQYRGQYDPDILARIGPNRSQAFMRKTRVKVKTVDARIEDLLFPSNKEQNFTIEPTPVPSVAPEQRKMVADALTQANGGKPVPPDLIEKAIKEAVGTAAKGMSQVINDQLVECGYKSVAQKVIHSGNLFGTGILKAPLVERKIRTRYINQGGKWSVRNEEYLTPFVDFVPIWRFYPDMSSTVIDSCRYVYERHLMSRHEFQRLAERKSFRRDIIIAHIQANPEGSAQHRYLETELRGIGDRSVVNLKDSGLYEVLERWGWLTGEQLREAGVKVPQSRLYESFFTNVWMLMDGQIIKVTIQPINGVTWPYHLYYFDKDETSIFGEGLAAVMRDDQTMLNAAVRMILDSSALTAGPQFEVNTSLLARGERANEILPFKIWPRTGTGEDARAPAVRVLEVPNAIRDLREIMLTFENNADETTAIPRYLYGENPTGGAAGTMGGLSMLLGSAAIVIKNLVNNYDEGITKRFITGIYRWNMQFNEKNEIKGDFDVQAMGVASLVAKEVRAQQLDAFAMTTANPLDAPYVKRDKLLRQRADAHELSDIVKTEDEVREEMNSPNAQMQQQLALAVSQLQVANLEKTVAKLDAEVGALRSKQANTDADTIAKRVGAAYSAMQAGAVATESAHVAPAGDAILRASGWQDAQPAGLGELGAPGEPGQIEGAPVVNGGPVAPAGPGPAQPTPPAAAPTGPNAGMNRGIQTRETTDG